MSIRKMLKLFCIMAVIVIGAQRAEGQGLRALGYDEEGPCVLQAYDRDLGPHVAASFTKLVGRSGSVSLKLKKS